MGNMSLSFDDSFPATEITESINLLVHHSKGFAQKKYSDRTEMLVSGHIFCTLAIRWNITL